jgi:uncharacterized small protein (DUF1192 family)
MNRCDAPFSAVLNPQADPEGFEHERALALLRQVQELRRCNKRLQYDNLSLDAQLESHEETVPELNRQIAVLNSQIERLQAEVERQRAWIEPFQRECQERCDYFLGLKNAAEALAIQLAAENDRLKVQLSSLRYRAADKILRLIGRVPGLTWSLRKSLNAGRRVKRACKKLRVNI